MGAIPVPVAALERALGRGLPTGSARAAARELAARLGRGFELVEVRHFPIPMRWSARACRAGGRWIVEARVELDTLDLRDGSKRRQGIALEASGAHLVPEAFCVLVRQLYLGAFRHELDEATRIAGRCVFNPHRRGRR